MAFGSLIIGEQNHGFHAFLVPLRSYDTHEPLPGIELADIGPKARRACSVAALLCHLSLACALGAVRDKCE